MDIRNFFPVITIVMVSLVISACCNCTEQACLTPPYDAVWLEADPNIFAAEELDDNMLIATDAQFNPIDTSYPIFLSQGDETLPYVMNWATFNFRKLIGQLKDYNYILINLRLNQRDTISNIQYDILLEEVVCNECSGFIGCEDDKSMVERHFNHRMQYNDELIYNMRTNYLRK